MVITKEKVVSIHYTLKDDAGEVIDSSQGQPPLAFIQGIGNIIAGLEKSLEGKKVGDKLQVSIVPEEGYGQHDENQVYDVPLSNFPADSEVNVGEQFRTETENGPQIATVVDVKDEKATVDLNHPLAGETLHFDVEVVEIRDASQEELAHGHVHGPEGHHH
ncbi:MAG: peptidylprolyl isomerase [Calditrichales bacterium]|nr:MAG: peptidylprolyl isomerase [Calditrichales bacterium]